MLRISALINKKRVSFSTTDAKNIKNLGMYAHILELKDNIVEIAITSDYLIVATEPPELRGRSYAPLVIQDRPQNNINAYDWRGNHKWNIAEIVGDIKYSFYGGSVTTAELLAGDVDPSILNDDHEYYFCVSHNDQKYIIDLTEKRLIKKVQTK